MAPPNGKTNEWLKFFGAVSSLILVLVVTPVAAALVSSSISLEKRLTTIEANRYTASMAMQDQLAVWKAIADLNLVLAQLPAEDFVNHVNDLLERVRALEIEGARNNKNN